MRHLQRPHSRLRRSSRHHPAAAMFTLSIATWLSCSRVRSILSRPLNWSETRHIQHMLIDSIACWRLSQMCIAIAERIDPTRAVRCCRQRIRCDAMISTTMDGKSDVERRTPAWLNCHLHCHAGLAGGSSRVLMSKQSQTPRTAV